MSPRRALLVLVCAGVLTACAERPAPGAPEDAGPSPLGPYGSLPELPVPTGTPVPEPPPATLLEESLALPPVTMDLVELQSDLNARFGGAPELGTAEISRDRTVFTIRWFGDPPAELLALVESHRDAPYDVRLERTRFRHGDLMAEARRLLRENPSVVTMTGPRNGGDGVIVGIDPSVAGDPDGATLASLGITSRFPLFPEAMSRAVPAGG